MIPSSQWQRVGFRLALVLGLSLILWAAYSPILALNFTGWDSLNHIHSASERIPDYSRFFTEQLANSDPWYRPISALSYGINYALWGLNAFGYHLTDVFIHWVVALGVFALGYQGTGRLWAAGLGGLLFALNPTLSPIVMNIAQRHDTLLTLGTVWTIALLYSAFHSSGLRRGLGFVGAWFAFVIAVGAKETGLFALALVLWMCWRYRNRLSGKYSLVWAITPFVLIALSYMAARQLILQNLNSPFENGRDLKLLFVYLQESILPRLDSNELSWVALALVVTSIIALCLPLSRNAEFRTWIVLFGMWIGIPLLLYFVVGVPQFRNRYTYIIIPPIVLLLVRLLAASPASHGVIGRTAVQLGAKLVLVGVLLTWLPFFGAPFFPSGLMEREIGASSYLQELDRLVTDLPGGTTIDFENVPSKFIHRDGMQMWLDLKWNAKQFRVGTMNPVPSFRGRAVLSMTQDGNRAKISAKYVSLSDSPSQSVDE